MKYDVLVYPNITYARNLEADSYVVAVGAMIRNLNVVRDDLRFTMLLPHAVESLADIPNVEQIEYDLPTYPNTMRCHFDTRAFIDAIDWKRRSWDVVWSHLPEHTLAIRNVFMNVTNEKPVFVGYSHWVEIPENTAYLATMFMANLAGVLSMRTCGVNSEWLRDLTIEYGDAYLSHELADAMRGILKVQYIGVDRWDHDIEPEPGLIVWNHRQSTYTGFPEALRAFDALWARRHDFRVMFTLGDVDRPYAVPVTIDPADYRRSYMSTLARAWFGIGRGGYAPWAVAVMDGLSLGVPYIVPQGGCYPEVVGGMMPVYDDRASLIHHIERMLDNPDARAGMSTNARNIANRFGWANRIAAYSDMFDDAIAALPMVKESTDSYERIATYARNGATKAEIMRSMGWGVGIPWTPYRTRLRADGIDVADQPTQLALA